MEDLTPIYIAIFLAAVAVVGLLWRITAWLFGKLEQRISQVAKSVEKVDGKVDEMTKTVHELRGEVKGRAYAESEEMMRSILQKQGES